MINLKKLNKQSGFSIIEVMAVVFIVSVGMVGMMTLVNQSIQAQRLNRHSLVAYQLAQEGVELVRVIRDSNWRGADLSFSDLFVAGNYCLDYTNLSLASSEVPCPFYLNNNFYVHDSGSGELTAYSRLISIEFLDGLTDAVLVDVLITWRDGTNNFSYNVATRLYDWR